MFRYSEFYTLCFHWSVRYHLLTFYDVRMDVFVCVCVYATRHIQNRPLEFGHTHTYILLLSTITYEEMRKTKQ